MFSVLEQRHINTSISSMKGMQPRGNNLRWVSRLQLTCSCRRMTDKINFLTGINSDTPESVQRGGPNRRKHFLVGRKYFVLVCFFLNTIIRFLPVFSSFTLECLFRFIHCGMQYMAYSLCMIDRPGLPCRNWTRHAGTLETHPQYRANGDLPGTSAQAALLLAQHFRAPPLTVPILAIIDNAQRDPKMRNCHKRIQQSRDNDSRDVRMPVEVCALL